MKKLLLLSLCLLALKGWSQNWTAINSPTEEDISDCTFINESTGWITNGAEVFKTIDGGTTWTALTMPPFPEYMQRRYNSISFFDENNGIIGCTNFILDYNNYDPDLVSTILMTSDGGSTWQYKNLGNSNSHVSSGIFTSTTTAYVIGQYGKSFKTTDSGTTWEPILFNQPGFSGAELFAVNSNTVYFSGLQNFSMAGAFGRLSANTWIISEFSTYESMHSLFFTDEQKGWACSNNGVILKTVNGGTNWTPCATNVTSALRDISFMDGQNGWAIADGSIISTTDGQNWDMEYEGTVILRAIDMDALNGTGYAVGNDGLILKYAPVASAPGHKKLSMSIYPNPSDLKVTIETGDSFSNTSATLYNSLGQIVRKGQGTGTIDLDTEDLNDGIYFLQLHVGDLLSGKKLIIAHRK